MTTVSIRAAHRQNIRENPDCCGQVYQLSSKLAATIGGVSRVHSPKGMRATAWRARQTAGPFSVADHVPLFVRFRPKADIPDKFHSSSGAHYPLPIAIASSPSLSLASRWLRDLALPPYAGVCHVVSGYFHLRYILEDGRSASLRVV